MQIQQLETNLSNREGFSPLLGISAISSHSGEILDALKSLGYPQKSIDSIVKCGSHNGHFVARHCSCSVKILPLTHHCNLRTCSVCAQRRKRRIFKDYSSILNQYSTNPHNREFLYFLTISPQNYSSLKEGLSHARKSFQKFIRNKYIKERVKGGLYVIETKNSGLGWHVHIHAIIYGRWLDNRIRGFCPCCKQNLIKKDHITQKYYCANRKCNNTESLVVNQDSKITQIWSRCSGRPVNMNISRQSTTLFTLNYMLKYVSANKDDFQSSQQTAEYIMITRKQKLITKFGNFFSVKITKTKCFCKDCGGEIEFIYNEEAIEIYRHACSSPPPEPKGLFCYSEN